MPQCLRYSVIPRVLQLVYCGSFIYGIVTKYSHKFVGQVPQPAAAAVHNLVYCGTLMYCGGAVVGVDAPQYKPFYTVP